MKETFDFRDALSFMMAGCSVMGPGNRVYKIENVNGEPRIICYPKLERPKQKRVEIKMNVDAILFTGWTLYEE